MIAPSPSLAVSPVTEPIEATPITVRPALAVAVARRAVPVVTAAASAALTTLAIERALAGLAMRGIERTPLARPLGATGSPPDFTRITVTRTTIIERITRPAPAR